MKLVILNMKEQYKFEIIQKVKQVKLSKNSTQITNKIIELYKSKYYDTSFKYFHEFLSSRENINISYSFIFKTLTNAHLLSLKPIRSKKKN